MALPSKVKPGDPIKASDWNTLIDCVRASQINPGSGVRVTRSPSGTTLAVDKTPPRTVTLPLHPFQVIQGPNSGNEPQIGIIANSHVINLSDKDDHEEDNSDWGLLSDDATDDDGNWFVCPSVGSKIWLQLRFDEDGSLLETNIEYGQVGNEQWNEFPDPISINVDDPDNPWQEFYHLLIAEVTAPEQDPRDGFQVTFSNGDTAQVTQILKTNVALVDATTTEDADEPNLPIMVAIPWAQPGTAMDGSADEINSEDDVKTPWSFAESVDDDFPFKLRGYVDGDGQGWITVAYGEVNGVAPDDMAQGDDPYEIKADDDGVVFVTITLDPDTREVVSFCFDMAVDEESIDDDDEETMHVVLGRFYIDTEADEDGLPVPFNTVAGNINMSVEPVTNADGRLCLDMVHTYLRDAVPTGFFNMEVFDTDEDGTPVEGCSSMFLSVGDADDSSNDGLTFQANNNYLEIVWGADQDSEYPIPAIKLTDSDGNVSKIDTGGLSFWDANGTEDNPKIDLSLDGLSQWDMDGNGSLLDAGGLSLWDSDANEDNPQVDLSMDGLKIWDMDGDGMKIDTTSLIFWDSSTSEDDPKFELDPDRLHFKDEDGDEANYDAGGITFDDTEGNTSNLDATNVTFTDSDGDSSTLDGGGLTFTSDSDTANLDATGLSIGENTALTDGDLDLGDDGTIEIGSDGSITVGAAVLSDGDLDLGGDGSIETATLDASDKITCDTLEADNITYQGSDLDDYIDDSIRTALDGLSASIDCDSMSVTFSYSY